MADLGTAVLRLTTDGTGLEQGLDKAEKKTSLAMKAIAAAAVAALIKIGKDCVDSFLEAEKATAKLTGAIAATGQAGNISVKAIEALASALQKTTIYSDEATVSAAAMLQQLGGLTERGLKMAIPVVQDLAAAMGMDLETAATLVGKAIAGNTGALSRYGIEVKEGATKSETFTNVLKGLNEKFGGMAEQLGKTTGGQLVIFRNEIDDLKESLGGLIAQGLNPFLASINRYFSVKSLLAIDPSTITSVSQLQAALKILRDRYAELSVVAAGHGTGLVRPGELAELQNKIEGFSRAIVKLGEAAKEAKGNKDTVIANVGGEADVAALAKLNQSLDDMGNRYQAIGQAYKDAQIAESMAMFIASSEDMANRTQAMGRAYKEAADMALNLGTNIRGLEDRFASVLPAIEGIAEPTQAALLAVSQAVGQAMQAAADASEDAAADSAQAWKDAQDGIKTFVDFASSAFSAIQDIASQFYKNQNALIDNELQTTLNALDAKYKKERSAIDATMKAGEAKYEADKLAIENSTLSEAEKTAALKKLDEDYYGALTKLDEDFEAAKLAAEKTAQGERNRIALDQFRAEKTATLIGIAIDTAKAIIQTFAQLGFTPLGVIAAAAMTAMGITQAALVANQPEPVFPALAQGGEFTVPPGYDNDSFLARMSSGERVSVTPAGESGGEMIHNTLILDGAVLADWYTRASRNRQILTTARSVIP